MICNEVECLCRLNIASSFGTRKKNGQI
jgi:hypothetical protein